MLEILSRRGGPIGIREAATRKITTNATRHVPRIGTWLVVDVRAALGTETVNLLETTASEIVLLRLVDSFKTIH